MTRDQVIRTGERKLDQCVRNLKSCMEDGASFENYEAQYARDFAEQGKGMLIMLDEILGLEYENYEKYLNIFQYYDCEEFEFPKEFD